MRRLLAGSLMAIGVLALVIFMNLLVSAQESKKAESPAKVESNFAMTKEFRMERGMSPQAQAWWRRCPAR